MQNLREWISSHNQTYAETQRYTGDFSSLTREKLSCGQNPFLLVITCSDSRVVPELILNAGLGEIFTIRTAGNILLEGEYGTLEYGIEHLHIQHVLVLGHTNCGAVHAAVKQEHGKYVDRILENIRSKIGEEKDERQASLKSALATAREISSLYSDVEVIPALYDILSGKVEFVDGK